jgi:apolipoprotein D and lipocalin family protein
MNSTGNLHNSPCRCAVPGAVRSREAAPTKGFTKLPGGLLRLLGSLALLAGCSSTGTAPIRTADYVDLPRFMGDWYVVAHIPAFLERQAYNAVESYRLLDNGRIATTFSFNDGGFDGKRKTYHPTGFVVDSESNAVWGMRFIWPLKADYRIVYVDAEYRHTIIGRNKRDYVWVMARSPQIPAQDMAQLTKIIAAQGYDTSKLRRVPQQWPLHRVEGEHTP